MSELIDIYNADRERTGRTAERYAELALGEYRLIVHVCLFNSCNEMLIQKRSESKQRTRESKQNQGPLQSDTCLRK